jgi:hypothetical protein
MKSFTFNARITALGHEWIAAVEATQYSEILNHAVEIETITFTAVGSEDDESVAYPLPVALPVELHNLPRHEQQSLQWRAEREAEKLGDRRDALSSAFGNDDLLKTLAEICRPRV